MKTNFEMAAHKLVAITELIDTPEDARELSRDVFSGMRITLEEVAEQLLESDDMDRQGYKLLMVAALIDTPEQAEEIGGDAWSGIRIVIEEVADYLHNV